MGIGDWGLGIGDWAQSPIPNPQSPIPNPQLLIIICLKKKLKRIEFELNKYYYLKINLINGIKTRFKIQQGLSRPIK
jgi:hypothetical protein